MQHKNAVITAMQAGVKQCHSCRKLQADNGDDHQHCQCCGDELHYRGHNSLSRTWALCVTSTLFLFLANIYPIMTVMFLGEGSPDTIISGVITLVGAGMYPVAAIVFIASVAVPLLKLIGMFWLLLLVQFDLKIDKKKCAIMFRMVQFIGRWSMLDLFVIAILVTLVNLEGLMTISGGAGATYFSTVVVLTMLAAHTFDPRLIWDLENNSANSSGSAVKGADNE